MVELVDLNAVRPGMRLAKSIFDGEGKLLLGAGITLRPVHIKRLKARGLPRVYVTTGETLDGILMDEPVSEEIRQKAYQSIKSFSDQLQLQWAKHMGTGVGREKTSSLMEASRNLAISHTAVARVKATVNSVLEEVLSQPSVMVGLVDLRSLDDPVQNTLNHCLQVAVLALSTGRVLGLDNRSLADLGTGAILHDVGKTMIPESILLKPGKLNDEEWAVVRQHSELGFEVLRNTRGIGPVAAHVAFQHHERSDGSGYPRGLAGPDISAYSKICAVCDVYDAMTSPRVYKPSVHPVTALRHIIDNRDTLYDGATVDAFTKVVAPYPVATPVMLNSGERALVKKLNPEQPDRPVVMASHDNRGRSYPRSREYDLSQEEHLEIADQLYQQANSLGGPD